MARDYAAEYRRRVEKAKREGYPSFYVRRVEGWKDWWRNPPEGTKVEFPDSGTLVLLRLGRLQAVPS